MLRKAFSAVSSFLATPFGVVAVTVLVWHGVQWALDIPINPIVSIVTLIIDVAITFFLLDWLTYFFAQFVLPIHKPEERKEIYARVSSFESGERGPILFVKNGRVIEHEGETNKKGPGVIVLDTASAVVLRTDAEIVGAVGPGVRFTRKDEFIIKDLNPKTNQLESIGVDLRNQWRYVGLSASQASQNIDPTTNPKAYNELEKIRKQTAGLTRDGFEVYAHISIRFRVKRDTNNNQRTQSDVLTQFGYDADSVTNAVTRELIELNKTENKKTRIKWKDLPEHLVVNLWREYVRKFKLEELFTDKDNFSNLQNIEYKVNQHVTQERVNPLDDIGSPGGPGRQKISREYAELQARGLQIIEVRIHHVSFERELEDKIVAQWSNDWMRAAKRDEDLMKEKSALAETASRNEALKRFARVATQKFNETLAKPVDAYSTLQDLVEPLKENLLPQNHTENEVEPILEKLDEILKKLLVLKHDQARKHEGGDDK
jgi:hypothetical protein